MSQPSPTSPADAPCYARVGVDWWATIVGGVITVLAVANLLPKIPW